MKQVLVVGGGPVGFALALKLALAGVDVALIEGAKKVNDDPRAGTIHPPTLEMFDSIGMAEPMMSKGIVVHNYQYRDRRAGIVADFDLGALRDDTPFPVRLMLEQHKVCEILRARLEAAPNAEVLFDHRLVSLDQRDEGVVAQIDAPEGRRAFEAAYVVGCDGGRSGVRKSMNVSFDGFTYPERFLILSTRYDFARLGYAFTNYVSDPEEWYALFKVPGADDAGVWRVVSAADAGAAPEAIFDEAAVQGRLRAFVDIGVDHDVVHRNLYDVHQRVASSYRDGRLLIAGDAAHINNPLGGMGMNFGLHDAFNLADKLTRVLLNGEDDALLDLYDRQRRTVAREYLQQQTIENKNNIEQKDPVRRGEFQARLRSIAADRRRLRDFLLRGCMIEGVRRAASIS